MVSCSTGRFRLSVSIGLFLTVVVVSGCQREGIRISRPPWESVQKVATPVVMEPVMLERFDFLKQIQQKDYHVYTPTFPEPWINKERFTEVCRDYFSQAKLFQAVYSDIPTERTGRSGAYLILRPKVTMRHYARSTVAGTVLNVGTALVYSMLGGPDAHRRVQCDLDIEVLSPSRRHVATYHSSGESIERLVSERPRQFGPLVSRAFVQAMERMAGRIMVDNDVLMRAMTTDLGAKGLISLPGSHMRIQILTPSQIIVNSKVTKISGQVIGVDQPVELGWSINGVDAGKIRLEDTDAASVKEFSVQAPLPAGVAKVVLCLRDKSAKPLAQYETAYLCSFNKKSRVRSIQNRWAVVIGVGKYAHSGKSFQNLKYADKDAKAFSAFLQSPQGGGFSADHILCLTNEKATVENVRYAMFEFLAKADKDDLAVVFFSGHGMPKANDKNFFMLCHDTRPDRLASTSFPMWDIDTALRRFIRAQHVVIFADACHAGAISTSAGAKGANDNSVHRYLRQLSMAKPGLLIFTASEAMEKSFESDKHKSGVFTRFLLDGLKGKADVDSDGIVTAGEIVEYVRKSVIDATKGKQHPNASGQYDRKLPLSVVKSAAGKLR
jgi:hypothetical protein